MLTLWVRVRLDPASVYPVCSALRMMFGQCDNSAGRIRGNQGLERVSRSQTKTRRGRSSVLRRFLISRDFMLHIVPSQSHISEISKQL